MSVTMLPIIILPLTFLFVLLIILVCKAPKAGAWIVGGLLLLAPLILYRFAKGGGLAHDEEVVIPLFVLPAVFLFVLLVILLAKAPKAGIAMIVALVVMVVAGGFIVMFFSHSPEVYVPQPVPYAQIEQRAHPSAAIAVIDGDSEAVHEGWAPVAPTTPSGPLSPIWSEGVEQEFEADVYPSVVTAARALGRRMAKPIRIVASDPNAPIKVVLFQESHERLWMAAFAQTLEQELPDVQCSVEADLRNIRPSEIGLTFRVSGPQAAAFAGGSGMKIEGSVQESTRIEATAFTEDRRAGAEASFILKPWVEHFGTFASTQPEQSLIVARSTGACTSESEANQQSLDDARSRLTEALGRETGRSLAELGRPPISTLDVLNGGFVEDRFVQSFDTTTGKVWRQAMLIDVSGQKLWQLANVKVRQTREVRMSWARMGLSVVGVLVLISVIYFFLNMATRGYYEWSLRIAGVVLAVVAIVSILMIVR
ncbi:MAG: hypothetical protein KBE65_08980 [Phycisphaerae bacterium]|nr:hypothetical protein [Phycisphaerae bacterium]